MKSFEKNYIETLTILHRLITAIRQIGEYRGKQDLYRNQAPEMLENLRRAAMIQSSESSNRLEGITADIKRIEELVEEKTAPANRTEAEIAGYRDVLYGPATVRERKSQLCPSYLFFSASQSECISMSIILPTFTQSTKGIKLFSISAAIL